MQSNIHRLRKQFGGDVSLSDDKQTDKSRASWIRISKPSLPSADQLLPYIQQIDAARFYTNGGALQHRLLIGLAQHFRVNQTQIGLAGSGTAAITGLLLAAAGRAKSKRPLCVCPSYTFVATACAAEVCGFEPYLSDVDPDTWVLDPVAVEHLPEFNRVGAVIVVAPYGRPLDLTAWQDFSRRTGRVVVVDAAAGFDTISPEAVMASGLPVAISLHATKTLSTAEGGLMLCADSQLLRRAVAAVNFGFDGDRSSILSGTNGKISEYHSAVGLADLEAWAHKRAAFILTASIYSMLADIAFLSDRIEVNTQHAVPYVLFVAQDEAEAHRVGAALLSQHIEFRRWYGEGLHVQPAYANCLRGPLPVTANLSARVLGLPFSIDLSARDIDRVIDGISRAVDDRSKVTRRISRGLLPI